MPNLRNPAYRERSVDSFCKPHTIKRQTANTVGLSQLIGDLSVLFLEEDYRG